MKHFFTLLLVLVAFIANSQVTVDPTFNPIDGGTSDFLGVRGPVNAQVIQSDGKILIGGGMNMNGYNNFIAGNLIRLNTDGSRDTTFGVANGANGIIRDIALQNDGKIVIVGSFTAYAGVTVNRICRLNSNGSFDPSFNPGLGATRNSSNALVNSIKILTDGKILIVGDFGTYNGFNVNGICRINSNGSYDNTFNSGGSGFGNFGLEVSVIEIQPDGKILVGGVANNTYNGINFKGLVRLNSDGSPDLSFNLNSFNSSAVYTIKLRADNKIWVGGTNLYVGFTFNYVGILLLNSNGRNDATFAPTTGTGSNTTVYTITQVGTNKLFIGGEFASFNGVARNRVALINTDGSLDATALSTSSFPTGSFVRSSSLDASNSIIYSGSFNNSISLRNNNIEKLTSSYSIDLTFNPSFGADATVKTFATQADGKIIIGGVFSRYNNIGRSRLARLTENGELDNTFTVGTGLNNDVNEIAIQANGSIITVGNFTNYNTTNVNRIVRTDATGAIDASFATNIGTGANGAINTIALQTDGKIIIGGNFTSFNGNSSNYIARLNANGTFDNTFNIGNGAFGLIRVVRIQTDGKILVGGDFQFFNGVTVGRVLRLNVDGTSDNTFNATGVGANGSVYDIDIESDGGILIAGNFLTFNTVNKQRLVKVSSLGVVNSSFTFSSGEWEVYFAHIYGDGKILLGVGNGGSATALKRHNSNGSTDLTFPLSSAPSGSIFSNALILGDGNKLLIAGSFSSFNSVGRNRIARLTDASIVALPLTLQSLSGSLQNGNTQLNWHTSNEINTDQFIIERSLNNTSFTAVGATIAKGNSINTYQFTDFNTINLGVTTLYYRLKMQDKNGSFTYSATVPIKLSTKSSITLLPNPAKNTVWLQIQQTTNEKISISVSDISGKILLQLNPTVTSGTTVYPLQVSQLAAGVYFVTIKGNNKNETLKLVKE